MLIFAKTDLYRKLCHLWYKSHTLSHKKLIREINTTIFKFTKSRHLDIWCHNDVRKASFCPFSTQIAPLSTLIFYRIRYEICVKNDSNLDKKMRCLVKIGQNEHLVRHDDVISPDEVISIIWQWGRWALIYLTHI